MRLTGLEPLYHSMRAQGMGRVKFRYLVNHLSFERLFFIDTRPFELVMGCLGHNFAIFGDVHPGFEINIYLGDLYEPLRKALFANAGTDIKLEPGTFFAEFNQIIPRRQMSGGPPTARRFAQVGHELACLIGPMQRRTES